MAERYQTLKRAYSGYHRNQAGPDLELAQVGPDTPGGEYLRRFWHPIELSSSVQDRPVALRVLGEDLVLFRDLSGNLGLLDKHCPHRGASLEFGKITECGIQCCYHGWHFACDGTLLETPVHPDARYAGRLFHAAYPVRETAGLIFAYMGPPDRTPDFPHFDFFDDDVEGRILYKRPSPCNWIQTRDNEVDNDHGYFLHTVMAGIQLTTAHQELAKINLFETPSGLITTQSRRVGKNIFVRINAMILPNLSRIACIEDGQGNMVFDRRGPIVHWSVPVDDENCFVIGWNTVAANLPDKKLNAYMDRERAAGHDLYTHPQLNFTFGQDGERSYAERQRIPGDWDAWVSQGPIHIHALEHLVPGDRAIVRYRGMLRDGIRAVAAGEDPKGLVSRVTRPLETYASNTAIPVPQASTLADDAALIDEVERELVARTLDGTYRDGYRHPRQEQESSVEIDR